MLIKKTVQKNINFYYVKNELVKKLTLFAKTIITMDI